MPKLDRDTRHHLNCWLARHVDVDHRGSTVAAIGRALHASPDLIDRDYSWQQMAAMGGAR